MDMNKRFRGFLPVVVDIETGGFNPDKDAVLEVAAVFLNYSDNNIFRGETLHYHVYPFANSNICPNSLKITGIDPFHPLRPARQEEQVANLLFGKINQHIKDTKCSKAILVGHNANFDLNFIKALSNRTQFEKFPFHDFSTLDTVTLGAMAYGQTVLSKIAKAAGFEYDTERAHGAKYDAELTADIFCQIVNNYSKQFHSAEE